MKKLDTHSFDQFYHENRLVLDNAFVGSHLLDSDRFNTWKESFRTTVLIEEATATRVGNEEEVNLYRGILAFIDQFKPVHISFDTFKRNVWRIVDEIFEEKADLFVLLLPEKIEKSGLWVSMIAWERIKDKIKQSSDFEFIVALETNLTWLEERVENKPEIHMITMIFDDATYSGTQYIQKTIAFQYQRYELFKSQYGRWTHAVMIPFISERAKDLIKRSERSGFGPKIWFPSSATLMPVVKDVDENDATIPVRSVYYPIFDENFDGIYNRGMTYFDHKLADNVSVYTFIMKNAPLLSEPFQVDKYNLRIGPSFINNCGPAQEVFGKEKEKIIDTASNLKPDCFLPPYKRHNWTYQERSLDTSQTLVQITSKCMVCERIGTQLFREYGMPATLGLNICSKQCQLKMYN